jgi:hypothetical protein
MGDWWDFKRRQRRRWQAWRQWGDKRLQAWRRQWRDQDTNLALDTEVHMEVNHQAVQEAGKAVMAEMGQQTMRALKAAVRQELLEEVKAEAFEQALAELDDRLQHDREQLRDTFAKQKQALTGELEDELDRRTEQIRLQTRDAFEERLLTLKDDLSAAVGERDRATAALVNLVQQLVSERKCYLHDAGITELDLVGLNTVLAPKGIRVQAEYRASERQVTCTLTNGAAQRTVFWREAVRPGTITAEV